MASLDDLYGEGSSDAFREAITLPEDFGAGTINERSMPSDSLVEYVEVECKWGRSIMRIRCEPDRLHFSMLRSDQPGLYTALMKTSVPDWARERGVKEFTAQAHSGESASILKARGVTVEGAPAEWQGDRKLRLEL